MENRVPVEVVTGNGKRFVRKPGESEFKPAPNDTGYYEQAKVETADFVSDAAQRIIATHFDKILKDLEKKLFFGVRYGR